MEQNTDSRSSVPSSPAASEPCNGFSVERRNAALEKLLPLVRLLARHCAQEALTARDGGRPMTEQS